MGGKLSDEHISTMLGDTDREIPQTLEEVEVREWGSHGDFHLQVE